MTEPGGIERGRLVYATIGALLGAIVAVGLAVIIQADSSKSALVGAVLGAWGGILFGFRFVGAVVGASAGFAAGCLCLFGILSGNNYHYAAGYEILIGGACVAVGGGLVGVRTARRILNMWKSSIPSTALSEMDEEPIPSRGEPLA